MYSTTYKLGLIATTVFIRSSTVLQPLSCQYFSNRRSYVITKTIFDEQRIRAKRKSNVTKMEKQSSVNGDTNANVELRHIRYRKQVGDALSVPCMIELQVIGNGRGGTPRAFYINTDHCKYLFNCGEGTQRVTTEHRMKMSRIENIFITHNNWQNIGGLQGFCLTADMACVPKVVIHGPANVEAVAATSRSFAQLKNLEIEKRDITHGEYSDSVMTVTYVPISPAIGQTPTESPVGTQKLTQNHTALSMAYVCKPKPKTGTLQLDRCVDLGIPRGPMLGKLQQGEDVTLDDGRVIKRADVFSESEPCNPIIVIECPSLAYVESLLNSEVLKSCQAASPTHDDIADLIVHFTPSDIMADERYQRWMSRFPASTKHLVLNDCGSEVAHEGVYKIQAMLNQLHSGIFPLLPHQIGMAACDVHEEDKLDKLVYGETNLKYVYRGGKNKGRQFYRDLCIKIDNDQYIKDSLVQEGFPEALQKVRQEVQEIEQTTAKKSDYPEILFLGTGSAVPCKVRNVSAIWLNMSNDQSMLLDCGENTYGQLYRHYGERTPDMLAQLVAIFVSHLHADHHMGIMGVAEKREQVLHDRAEPYTPLIVIVPGSIRGWLENMDSHGLHLSKLIRVIPLEYLYTDRRRQYQQLYSDLLSELNLHELDVVKVIHKQFPHGVSIRHKAGWHLVYSGDTKPCKKLIEAGVNCDILIHEATMEDGMEDEAAKKNHSTISQAIEVGVAMNAGFTLLTHFSQRYAKAPLLGQRLSQRVGVAFDNMRVNMSQLDVLPCLLPALPYLFADAYEEMQSKTQQRIKRKLMMQVDERKKKMTKDVSSSVETTQCNGDGNSVCDVVKRKQQTVTISKRNYLVQR